jgi:hypothetical protein
MFLQSKQKDSDIIAFAKCPFCYQLINVKGFTDAVLTGSRNCPSCNKFIDKKAVIDSCAEYVITTKAIQSAGHLLSAAWMLVIVLGLDFIGMAFSYFGGIGLDFLGWSYLAMSVLILLGGFLGTHVWLLENSKIPTTEKDFLITKVKMRRFHTLWLWANIINLTLWFILIKFLYFLS